MAEERRRSHDRRKTEARAYLDELRALDVNVELFLRRAVAAESVASSFCMSHRVAVREALPVLIHRNCLNSPSVLLALHDLFVLGADEVLLRKVGDVIGRRVFSVKLEPRKS